MGKVVDVEIDQDKLVRTCTVQYSLIQNLSEAARLTYKGVTKKIIRVAVQRLVLILPVEEQDVDHDQSQIAKRTTTSIDKKKEDEVRPKQKSLINEERNEDEIRTQQKSLIEEMIGDMIEYEKLTRNVMRSEVKITPDMNRQNIWVKDDDEDRMAWNLWYKANFNTAS